MNKSIKHFLTSFSDNDGKEPEGMKIKDFPPHSTCMKIFLHYWPIFPLYCQIHIKQAFLKISFQHGTEERGLTDL